MKYLLVLISAAFVAGTAVGFAVGEAAASVPVWIVGVSLATVGLLARRIRWGVWALLASVFALGVLFSDRTEPFPIWLRLRAAGIEQVTGTVVSYPSLEADHAAFDFDPDSLPAGLRVTWFREERAEVEVHYGDRFTLVGSVRLPKAFDGFDYPAYLARQGIFASMVVEGDAGRLLDDVGGSAILRWGDRLRQGILRRLREALGTGAAGLAQGLLLGDRAALSDEVEGEFRRTGLMHVLAVSGLHLGIVLAGVWFGLRQLGARPRIAYPIVGASVLLVLWIVGPRVSLIRASLLFAFLGLGSVLADLGWILRRTIDPLNGLAAAAVVLLAIDPGQLLDSGFQLSFAATAGILVVVSALFRRRWEPWVDRLAARSGRLGRLVRPIVVSLVVSAAAQAGVAPVVAWHFGTFHPFLILFNLIVVPLVTVALAVGVPGVVLLGLGAPAVVVLPFGWSLYALSGAVRLLAWFPLAEIPMPRPAALWLATMVAFTALAWRYSDGSSS